MDKKTINEDEVFEINQLLCCCRIFWKTKGKGSSCRRFLQKSLLG